MKYCQNILRFMFGLFILLSANSSFGQWMLINEDGGEPKGSAALEIESTSRGFLAPRMTTAQMNAVSSPDSGLLIYNIDSSAFFFNNGSGWATISSSGATQFAVPAGAILPFGGDTSKIPAGFLLCNGKSLDTTSYSELYAAIGSAWGGGSSNFNVPDLRGQFLRGTNLGAGYDSDAASRTAIRTGGNTGDAVGSHQADAFQGHYHNIQRTSGTNYQLHENSGTSEDVESSGAKDDDPLTIDQIASQLTATTPETMGSNGTPRYGKETRPRNLYVNYIICYSSSIAAAGTNSSVFQGSVSASQLPTSVMDSSRITDDDGSAKIQTLVSDIITFTTNSNEAMRISPAGNVGIGNTTAAIPLQVTGGTDATLTAGSGHIMIGQESGANLLMDNNEIMARNNGATSTLSIQSFGGDFKLHGQGAAGTQFIVDNNGKMGYWNDNTGFYAYCSWWCQCQKHSLEQWSRSQQSIDFRCYRKRDMGNACCFTMDDFWK